MTLLLQWPLVGNIRRWWMDLNPTRQDRLAMLAPLASVLIFFLAIVAALTYLRVEEMNRDQEAIERDVEYAQQSLRQRLTERQEQLSRLGREIAKRETSAEEVRMRINVVLNRYPEVQGLAWVDENRRVWAAAGSASVWNPKPQANTALSTNPDHDLLFMRARTARTPFYYQALRKDSYAPMLQLVIPLREPGKFNGALMAEYSVDGLYRYGIPAEISARYAVSLSDAKGSVLAGVRPDAKKLSNLMPDWISYPTSFALHVAPVGIELTLRAQAYRASLGVVGSGLFWLVGGAEPAHRLDAGGQLAPYPQTSAHAAGPGYRDQFPPRHGKLHVDRHARHGPTRTHHIRQCRFLPDDGLERHRTRRSAGPLSLLARRRPRQFARPAGQRTERPNPAGWRAGAGQAARR